MSDPLAVIAQCLAEIGRHLLLAACKPQRAVGKRPYCGEYHHDCGGQQPRPTAKLKHVRLSRFTHSYKQITSAVKRSLLVFASCAGRPCVPFETYWNYS